MNTQEREQLSNIYHDQNYGMGMLYYFPNGLRERIVKEVLEGKYERATDIWYLDEPSETTWVIRYNIQWHLNQTATLIWNQLEDKSIKDMVNQLCEEYGHVDCDLIKYTIADFLVFGCVNGLVRLVEEQEEKNEKSI